MILLISTILLFALMVMVVVLALRTWFVLSTLRNEEQPCNNDNHNRPMKTLVVLGSGGHTTEMLHLIKNLNADHYTPLIYVVATTDTTSRRRVDAFGGRAPDHIYEIPRSREVGQSYVSSIVTTLYSFVHAVVLVLRIRPDLVLTNGPGTCVPIVVVTLIGRILGICKGRNVFVESFCRVTSLSLTGNILYRIVDMFVVHWEELHEKFPRSKLVTTFVPRSS